MPADGGVFLIISALSNVGMSHDPVSVVGKGSYLLSGIMLIGRLAPLAVLWWMARTTRDAEVLVG
jgi:Trk-type K+ transport system membrane component